MTRSSTPAFAAPNPGARGRRSGMSIVYIVIIITVMFGFASLAMDYGRVQLVKTQLYTATDQAAKWGAQWVASGSSATLVRCNAAMADNLVDGTAITLAPSDIQLGSWNAQTRVFTAGARPQNAVRLTSSAQVPLLLGAAVGQRHCTVRASVVSMAVPMGIVGLNFIEFKNNTLVASYNSSVRTNPTQGNSDANTAIGSNGTIGQQNNGDVRGDVYLGPSGLLEAGWAVTGGTSKLDKPLPTPLEPAWNPGTNPGGIPQNYTVNSNTTLPGGTYWFTSLRVNNRLIFSGPATLYVNGNIDINAQTRPQGLIPANLKVYQIGNNRQFNAGGSFWGHVIAPRSDFETKNNFDFYGCCIFRSITVMNNGSFYYDEAVGSVASVSMVK